MDKINRIVLNQKIEQCFSVPQNGGIYRAVIEDTEKVLIEYALERCEGNQLTAARMLGVNRNTPRTKIKKLAIDMRRYKL